MRSRRNVLALGGLLLTAACGKAVSNRAATQAPSTAPTTVPTTPRSAAPTPSASVVHHAPAHSTTAVEITNGPRTAPAVALTFHGGGDVTYAQQILEEVEARGAKVTVFAVGDWLQANPTMAQRILAGGHELGNHTFTHPDDFASLPVAARQGEIVRCAQVITQQTGQRGGHVRPAATTHASASTLAAIAAAGYDRSISYDVDSLDFEEPGVAAVVSTVSRLVQPGSIVSLHTGYAETVQAMPGVLDALQAKGLRPVTVTELLA